MLELSHELDYLRWIFGEVDWVKATLSRQSNLEIDVEDTAHLTLGFSPRLDDHQLIGVVDLDFIRRDTVRLCTAIGERGSLRWDGIAGRVEQFENDRGWKQLVISSHKGFDSYRAEWEHFIECVNGQVNPLVTGEDGRKILHLIDAARRSSKTGSIAFVDNDFCKQGE